MARQIRTVNVNGYKACAAFGVWTETAYLRAVSARICLAVRSSRRTASRTRFTALRSSKPKESMPAPSASATAAYEGCTSILIRPAFQPSKRFIRHVPLESRWLIMYGLRSFRWLPGRCGPWSPARSRGTYPLGCRAAAAGWRAPPPPSLSWAVHNVLAVKFLKKIGQQGTQADLTRCMVQQ